MSKEEHLSYYYNFHYGHCHSRNLFYNTCMSGKDVKAHYYIMMEANYTYISFLLFTKFWSNFFVMKKLF